MVSWQSSITVNGVINMSDWGWGVSVHSQKLQAPVSWNVWELLCPAGSKAELSLPEIKTSWALAVIFLAVQDSVVSWKLILMLAFLVTFSSLRGQLIIMQIDFYILDR